jgi:hypothetical protein
MKKSVRFVVGMVLTMSFSTQAFSQRLPAEDLKSAIANQRLERNIEAQKLGLAISQVKEAMAESLILRQALVDDADPSLLSKYRENASVIGAGMVVAGFAGNFGVVAALEEQGYRRANKATFVAGMISHTLLVVGVGSLAFTDHQAVSLYNKRLAEVRSSNEEQKIAAFNEVTKTIAQQEKDLAELMAKREAFLAQ